MISLTIDLQQTLSYLQLILSRRMTSQEKYSAMSYEKLADYVVLGGPDAPFEGIIELIHRGPSQADYLLRYV